jgi:hypothetical protein
MKSRTYALEQGGPKRLTVSWNRNWKNMALELDGKPLLTIPASNELQQGRQVQVEGGTLRVQLRSGFLGKELLLSLNGRPLPGTADDPRTRFATAYTMIYFVGGLTTSLGLLSAFLSIGFLRDIGVDGSALVFGIVFLCLALWVHKRQSRIGLALAVGLFGLDALFSFAVAQQPGPIFVKVVLLVYMWRGFGAIKALRRENQLLMAATKIA